MPRIPLAPKRPRRFLRKIVSLIAKKTITILGKIRAWIDFRNYSRKKRVHFFINLAAGSAIVVLLHFLQHTRWGEGTLDTFFDLFIRSESRKTVRIQEEIQKAPILFVDIDHETYKEWGEPLITPRDKLAGILRLLHESEARVIVLDILLEGSDCLPGNDQALLDAIEEIRLDPRNVTKIILPQRIGTEGDLKRNIFDHLFDTQPSPADSESQKVYRATPTLSATGSDDVVRYWNLYEKYLNEDGQHEIIWGYPIVAVMLAVEGTIQKLEPFGERLRLSEGGRVRKHEILNLTNGRAVKLPFDKSHRYLQRLRFLLVPPKSTGGTAEDRSVSPGNLFQTVVRYDELEYYRNSFRDKIVIIGNSSPDVGDIHRTPVGEMAGMYILGNSINTILVKEQPFPPPAWLSILVEISVVIVAAYVFLYFTSLLAQVIASVAVLLVFGCVSYVFFLKAGVFLNFVFAVVGMGFHETFTDVEEIIEKRGIRKFDKKEADDD